MQNVGATWFMTSLAPSPAMVALVQAATSLPVFLVGLPTGALADIVDRRRFLLWTQGWMLAAATVLGVLNDNSDPQRSLITLARRDKCSLFMTAA
jgi:MFS family permease